MMKNKLFKLENNQGTKQAAITMKKNRLFKQDSNQSKNQISITMNLPNAQNTKYRTPFFPVHPSGAYSECTNATRFKVIPK